MIVDRAEDVRSLTLSEVLRLHLNEGLSARQIAKRMKLSRNTVRAMLRNGLPKPRPDARVDSGGADAVPVTTDETACGPSINISDEARMALVCGGYFVLGQIPYGMKAAHERQRSARTNKWVIRSRLEPGDRQEVKIVRLIFELYVCRTMPVNHILNSLLAEEIPIPSGVTAWTLAKIDRILGDPSYIGATRYKDVIRYGAFPPVIESWIFHAAQSRRCFEKLSKSGSLVQHGILESGEGDVDE